MHANPAREESIRFYQTDTGDTGPLRIDALNAYWRQRLRTEILSDPLGWLALEGRKAAYLAGNFEQYNNKTYSFHQARSPWLRWNPLGWGLLLLTGTLGFIALGGSSRPLLVAAAAIAAGILLSYASARFRLPLAALLCALAGGALATSSAWRPGTRLRQVAWVALLLGLGVLTYGGWFNGNDRSTYVQDHLLTALAAERVGDDQAAWDEARAALRLDPWHHDALCLGVTGYFNLLLGGRAIPGEEPQWLELAQRAPADELPLLVGLAHWRAGDPVGIKLWRTVNTPEGWSVLALSGEATPAERARLLTLSSLPPAGSFRALLAARESPTGDPELKAAAARLFRPRK